MGNKLSCVSKKNAGAETATPVTPAAPVAVVVSNNDTATVAAAANSNGMKEKEKEEVKEEVVLPQKHEPVKAEVKPVKSAPPSKYPLKPPNGFRMEVANVTSEDEHICEENMPQAPFSDFKMKDATEKEKEALREMDQETLDVSQRTQDNFPELMWQLIYARGLKSDLDRLRAIFLWLCAKNMKELHFENAAPGSPEEVLSNLESGKSNYADVFTLMCKHANIKCVPISGHAKGPAFVPGLKLDNSSFAQHTWNAAQVAGHWHLVDTHWAARRMVGKEPTLENVDQHVEDFYYMTNPEHMKMSHFPNDEKWQLTATPISVKEFENHAPVKPAFFRFDIELQSHPNGYIESDESLVIKLRYPEAILNKVAFTFSLREEMTSDTMDVEDLTNYGIHGLVSRSPPVQAFTFRFPRSGTYVVLIYARDTSCETFNTVCEYRVKATLPPATKVPLPYPPTQQFAYGASERADKLGIVCDHADKLVIRGVRDSVDIKFHSKLPNTKLPPLIGQLRGMGLDEKKLSRFILQRVVMSNEDSEESEGGPTEKLVMTAFLPKAGEYALEVYSLDPEKEETSQYYLTYQFLLDCEVPHKHGPLPVLPGNFLGPMPEFKQLGLATVSHPDPLIRVAPVESQDEASQPYPGADVGVKIRLPPPNPSTGFPTVRVIAQLTTMNDEGEEVNLTEYVLQQVEKQVLTCLIRFTQAGLYKMHLYAHQLPDVEDAVPVVYTYLFECPARLSASALPYQGAKRGPYPKQSNKWKEGATLLEPIDGTLHLDYKKDNRVRFAMLISRAKDVAVVVNDDVFHLEMVPQEGTDACRWEGDVTVPRTADLKLCVAGRWTTQMSNYPTLLEYRVKV